MEKYKFLQGHNLEEISWSRLHPEEPYQFFVPKDFSLQKEYEKGFKLDELFVNNVSGIKTSNDNTDHGNSGGPVLVNKNGKYTVIGILSGANMGSDASHRKGRVIPIGAAL